MRFTSKGFLEIKKENEKLKKEIAELKKENEKIKKEKKNGNNR